MYAKSFTKCYKKRIYSSHQENTQGNQTMLTANKEERKEKSKKKKKKKIVDPSIIWYVKYHGRLHQRSY
jgi:hypothetical protein